MKTRQVKCIICEKKYPRRVRRRKGRSRGLNERGINTITCSHKCSRIYHRVYNRIREKVKNET